MLFRVLNRFRICYFVGIPTFEYMGNCCDVSQYPCFEFLDRDQDTINPLSGTFLDYFYSYFFVALIWIAVVAVVANYEALAIIVIGKYRNLFCSLS